jgi:tetracycline repressor-like protein
LIAAADELFAAGQVPTVATVAERADVSRATAYRYFPSQESLLLETTFLGDSETLRGLPELASAIADPGERLASVADSLDPATHRRLAGALTLLFGIDPIVSLADNSDLERDEIPDMRAWTARRLVEAALADS